MSSASRPLPAGRPRRSAGRTSPTTIGWLAIIGFLFLTGLGIIGAIFTVSGYVYLASDLKPPETLTQIPLAEQSIVYDRTGTIELARFGDSQREVVTFDEIPPILLDATTAVEDKTFWENAGFDPVAIIAAEEMPKTATGKILHRILKNRMLERETSP